MYDSKMLLKILRKWAVQTSTSVAFQVGYKYDMYN